MLRRFWVGLALILIILCCIPGTALANVSDKIQTESVNNTQINTSFSLPNIYQPILESANYSVTYFYSAKCSACHIVEPEIEASASAYPEIAVRSFDIYNSVNNRSLLFAFADRYGIEEITYPIVFAGDTIILSGRTPITENLNEILQGYRDGFFPDRETEVHWMASHPEITPVSYSSPDTVSNTSFSPQLTSIPVLLIISAGLLDGINSCAFLVLVFLLIGLVHAGSRRQMILTGTVYTGAVFLFYLLAGLGILTIVLSTTASVIFLFIAAVVALTAGALQITEGLTKKSPVRLSISPSHKTILHRWMHRTSLPAAFVLGLLVALFELPCTGGIYLAILSTLASSTSLIEGFPYLILYNLMFVLPLALIIAVVAYGIPPERIDQWRKEHKELLRVVIGAALVSFGILIIWFQVLPLL